MIAPSAIPKQQTLAAEEGCLVITALPDFSSVSTIQHIIDMYQMIKRIMESQD